MVTVFEDETALVVTVNVALVALAMVTLEVTLADGSLLESATTIPLEGAVPLRVTVPWERLPPITAVGFRLRDEMDRGGGGAMFEGITWNSARPMFFPW